MTAFRAAVDRAVAVAASTGSGGVVSGTRMVTVEVTDEDIRIGRRYAATRCPVRRALRRAGVPVVAVFDDGYEFKDSPTIPLPVTVGRWIRRYDATGWAPPFTFRVGVPA